MYFLNHNNNNNNFKKGWIELITGCMYSGKTEEFIKRIIRLNYAKFKIRVFKNSIDNRFYKNKISSHNNKTIDAEIINNSLELLELINNKNNSVDVVGIDEIQFFDNEIVNVIDNLAYNGKIVIVNGLDRDFRGEPFYNVEKLMIKAEYVKKLLAICVKCGNLANMTQRLINGKPANYNDDIILIGEKEHYEARCRYCHEIFF